MSVVTEKIASQIPKDIHTILDHYSLDPATRAYICCSRCFAILPMTNNNMDAANSAYAASQPLPVCNVQPAPDSSPCGNPLWKIRRIHNKSFVIPIQKQVFQDFKVWLGKLLATPGIEDELFNSPPPEDDIIKFYRLAYHSLIQGCRQSTIYQRAFRYSTRLMAHNEPWGRWLSTIYFMTRCSGILHSYIYGATFPPSAPQVPTKVPLSSHSVEWLSPQQHQPQFGVAGGPIAPILGRGLLHTYRQVLPW